MVGGDGAHDDVTRMVGVAGRHGRRARKLLSLSRQGDTATLAMLAAAVMTVHMMMCWSRRDLPALQVPHLAFSVPSTLNPTP